MRARIYPKRSDLSPDGKHLIYFAMNGRWDTKTRGSWTAVSRAPYLKAIALWAKGDCWHGGGLFRNAQRYWLNDGRGHEPLLTSSRIARIEDWHPRNSYGGECPHVYYNRLQRDGWTVVDDSSDDCANWSFVKPVNTGWMLRKDCGIGSELGQSIYFDRHALVRTDSDVRLELPDAEWADVDRARLAWAAKGCLHAAYLNKDGLKDARCLHDFNDMTFEAIAAPY